ncbi:MAG: lysoplasmalogenase [Hyphomonas sp.]|uniref:lysoplasmalogenase n=1 Tax=Hyphomonas sp. TaxID=87 RepID=UPI003528B33C
MTPDLIALTSALVLGVLYWLLWCWREDGGLLKTLVKTGSTALLALFAYLAGGPWLLVAGLALSSAGDLFLALDGRDADKWLKPGMGAFFLAHVAYIALFWGLPVSGGNWLVPVAQVVLALAGVTYARWLSPSLGEMRIPVFAYTGIILGMGVLALRLDPQYLAVTLGAMMFVASDMILALQLFTRPAGEAPRVVPSILVWGLYYGGQALIAWGAVHPFA